MNNYIDVEKLHRVLEGKLVGRSTGQSFARLVQMAQSIEFLPNGRVVHIAANEMASRDFRLDFKTILNYLGMGDMITVTTVERIKFDNGCEARFLSASNLVSFKNSLVGTSIDNYFVDHFAEYLINCDMHDLLQSRLK
jgi:hypothetical protein